MEQEEGEIGAIRSNHLRKLIGCMLCHPAPLAIGLVLMVATTAAALLEPRLFGFAIDEAIVPRDWSKLRSLSAIYFGVILIRVVSVIGQTYYFEKLGQRVAQDLRCRLFSHLQRLPVSAFDRNPAGRLMTRVTNDISSLSEMFSAGFVALAGNALLLVGILVWLLVLDLRLGLIAGTVFPVMAILTVYFSARLKVAYREARTRLSALNAFLAENLLGMKIIHLFNRQSAQLGRFNEVNERFTDSQFATVRIFALFHPVITICSGIAVSLVIWYGVGSVHDASLAPGVLVAFLAYVLALFQPLREMADKWNIFLSGMASAERVFSILEWPVELPAGEGGELAPAVPIASLRGHIIFENVWFAYEGDHWILKDFSLEISPGSQVGVVGHTGAGKTTLISLLMRFYEPQRGRILLDGKDLRDYDKRALRASIGIVQQDVFLFSGSRADNVDFWAGTGKSGAELGERGGSLSAGERQVLAFERARAANPSIWILDEATANVDSGTEARLQQELESSSQGRTAVLIAHRLATVRNASNIIVLHKGQILEQGSHGQLIDLDGLYARLYRYQRARELHGNQNV
ncbi:MAG: hypothetical protein A2X94_07480 [Bdellovibrionales bacterium GWB1_55_8]|nr:MAG: hypothetical protein A2X94_07480 [Bdellovibrionales bacterium GWB1_55_8]